jgi:hypothetical protein
VVVHAPQIVAIRHRGECAVEWQDLEPVSREIELADDLGTQQRHDIRADGILESRVNLFRDGSATKDMAPFQHEDLAARSCETGGIHETVVPTADDDDVVVHACCARDISSEDKNAVVRARSTRAQRPAVREQSRASMKVALDSTL